MAKKLHYTDPLKSAYMAREFGVEFEGSESIRITDTILGKIVSPIVYHIHPNSLHIFEPIEGDVVSVVEDGTTTHYGILNEDKHIFVSGGGLSPNEYDDLKIIKRNGKHFFMAEGEYK